MRSLRLVPKGAYGVEFELADPCDKRPCPSVVIGWLKTPGGHFYGGVLSGKDAERLHSWLGEAIQKIKESEDCDVE